MGKPGSTPISRDEAASYLVPGAILYVNAMLPPEYELKLKYFVFAGLDAVFDDRPLLLKINSENRYSLTNQKLREHQFRLKQVQYTFLKWDSYLDCGQVWYVLTRDVVIDQVVANPQKVVVGHILKEHEREIVKFVRMSKSVKPDHKRLVAASFGLGD
jgi:hypothetical protein